MNSILGASGPSSPRPTSQRVPRLGLTIGLAIYGVVSLSHPGAYRLLDSVDLAIHEAGHLFFSPFGEFIGFAGGTLLQLIVPTAFVVYFMRFGDRHAASVVLWWVAQNFWNISVYVRDARTQALPLVGGGEHDWAYLLGRLGLLQHEQGIGRAVHAAGVLIFVVSVWWGFVTAGETRRRTADAPTPPSLT